MQGLFVELFLECDRKADVRVGPERVKNGTLWDTKRRENKKGVFTGSEAVSDFLPRMEYHLGDVWDV